MTEQEVPRRELLELTIGPVLGEPREMTDLVEGAVVGHRVDSLAYGQLAEMVLALDLVLAAHSVSQRLTAPQFSDLGFPGHPPCVSQQNRSLRRALQDGRLASPRWQT